MYCSRKYPYFPHRRDWNFLGVGDSVRPKNLKTCMRLIWNFQRGGGVGGVFKKSLPWGRYGYFLELHNWWSFCGYSKDTHQGADPGFFLGGVGCTTKKWCSWLERKTNFKSEYREEGFILGWGGGYTACPLPLYPPLISEHTPSWHWV